MVAPDVNMPFFVDVNLYRDNNILGYETSKRYKSIATRLWVILDKVNSEGGVNNERIQPKIFS